MADSLQIPPDVAKLIQIEVKDTSQGFRTFLVNLVNKVADLEQKVIDLTARVAELEP